ncbi:Zinc finger CCCH domain-containing protein 62-like [Quillaja saponaria]|uniref:Zinc finger CCCH domain-containing protein 62-like n=1 Tax=Quillaja saponaria TaxID=32244 RepID=A0AAD7L516_QUISA|nr:Zinc finger CCCH domain-containing protein 62-like [Quillaja saponaria]
MAVSEQEAPKDYEFEEQESYSETEESYTDYDSDDTDRDPSNSVLEETRAKFSKFSINKSEACDVEGKVMGSGSDPEEVEMVALGADEKGVKTFEEVQKIIEAGQLEKLKVDQCKVYMRKDGLRLTGNKDTLLQRIKEHLEILNGDACTGDVVFFEQNVYGMFDIASWSAGGPPCDKRNVAGRIVKESHGPAKQQHTFTIEVLWSKGEKPLRPLHPLLINGRNLYRLKTLRQRWDDEGERRKILMEKQSRGFVARSDREARIQEKETRKVLKFNM